MFGPEPLFPRLSLAAAIRDLKARSGRARANAARALPDALAADCVGPDAVADDAPSPASPIGSLRLEGRPEPAPSRTGSRFAALINRAPRRRRPYRSDRRRSRSSA